MGWLTGLLGGIWAKVAAAGAIVAAVLGAVFMIRRDAAKDERARIEGETIKRELDDRRIVDDVEADVAGLDARERRERLRRFSRN